MLRHRVTTSTAAVVDGPTPIELHDLVAEVDRSGRGGFLIVERHAAGSGETYLQARRETSGWVLELRDGGPDRQYEAQVADTDHVAGAFASWTTFGTAWRALAWRHLSRTPAWSLEQGPRRRPTFAFARAC